MCAQLKCGLVVSELAFVGLGLAVFERARLGLYLLAVFPPIIEHYGCQSPIIDILSVPGCYGGRMVGWGKS